MINILDCMMCLFIVFMFLSMFYLPSLHKYDNRKLIKHNSIFKVKFCTNKRYRKIKKVKKK